MAEVAVDAAEHLLYLTWTDAVIELTDLDSGPVEYSVVYIYAVNLHVLAEKFKAFGVVLAVEFLRVHLASVLSQAPADFWHH